MFKVPRPNNSLFDLGHYVTLRIAELRMSVPRFAKLGNLPHQTVYKLLKRKDWPISYITQFSELLKDDLTRFYRPSFVPEPVPKPELDKALAENEALQLKLQDYEQRIAELEKANLLLTTENKLMREMMEGRK
jgi:hypothetical protein